MLLTNNTWRILSRNSCTREFCLRATSHRWGHCTLLDSRFCPHSFSPEIPTRRDTRDPRCPFWTKSDLFHRMLSDCRYIFASVPAPLPRGDTPTFPAKFARPGRARPSLAFLSQHLRGTAFLSSHSPVCDFHALSPTIHVSDHGGYAVPAWPAGCLRHAVGVCPPVYPARFLSSELSGSEKKRDPEPRQLFSGGWGCAKCQLLQPRSSLLLACRGRLEAPD